MKELSEGQAGIEHVTNLINSNLKYYVCNESLRDSFYDGAWKVENCRLHQIFISQASYPLKGFHKLLEAVNYIKADYPDLLIKLQDKIFLRKLYKREFIW